jgi:8-oxo-dGTP pyrophosphatase MutT (NUDIX family)
VKARTKRTQESETRQVAALPWRRTDGGVVEVLMITSRETRRWVIPKGGRMVGKTDPEAAAVEAYEEAGVQGVLEHEPIGHFRYAKRLRSGDDKACVVAVYPLEVLIQLGGFPEQGQRDLRWMDRDLAAESVQERDLAELIRGFQPSGEAAG